MGCTCKGKNDCGYCNSMKSAYVKPEFKVGQTWTSSTGQHHKIILKEQNYFLTSVHSTQPDIYIWKSDGSYWYGTDVKLVAEFREPRSSEVKLYLYETEDGEVFWFTNKINSGYLLAQKTVTITEGEGMNGKGL